MQVKLAEKRGFCFGVEGAIRAADDTLKRYAPRQVYSLGPVIHNHQVCQALEAKGLKIADDIEKIPPGSVVLIRSHGVGPTVMQQLRDRGMELVDATCRLVKRAQDVVKQLHEQGYQVVMIGDKDHPEVTGVVAYAPNVLIINSEEDIDSVVPARAKLGIVAQTTHSPEKVGRLIGYIASKPFAELKVVNTLCMEVSRRQRAAIELCKQVDVMFVLGGPHSANTRRLAQLCTEQHVPTYHLEGWEQFDPPMVAGRQVAGVTAGASTPEWVIQDFVENLQEIRPAAK